MGLRSRNYTLEPSAGIHSHFYMALDEMRNYHNNMSIKKKITKKRGVKEFYKNCDTKENK